MRYLLGAPQRERAMPIADCAKKAATEFPLEITARHKGLSTPKDTPPKSMILYLPNMSDKMPAMGNSKHTLRNKAAELTKKPFGTGGFTKSSMNMAIQTNVM